MWGHFYFISILIYPALKNLQLFAKFENGMFTFAVKRLLATYARMDGYISIDLHFEYKHKIKLTLLKN